MNSLERGKLKTEKDIENYLNETPVEKRVEYLKYKYKCNQCQREHNEKEYNGFCCTACEWGY